jgi:hypothetical protein
MLGKEARKQQKLELLQKQAEQMARLTQRGQGPSSNNHAV